MVEIGAQTGDEFLTELLNCGADAFGTAFCRSKKKRTTAVHLALENGDLDLLLFLCHTSAASTPHHHHKMCTTVDSQKRTLMQLAVELTNANAIEVLQAFGITLLPWDASSPLIMALKQQKKVPGSSIDRIIRSFLNEWTQKHTATLLSPDTGVENHSLLITFLQKHAEVTVKPFAATELLQAAVDSYKTSPTLLTALLDIYAAESSSNATTSAASTTSKKKNSIASGLKLHDAMAYLSADAMQKLVSSGADLNLRKDGFKLHFFAVKAANVDVLRVLLASSGLDVRDVDTEGNTLLHWSVLKTQPPEARDEVMEFLVKQDADVLFVVNGENKTPAEYAMSKRLKKKLAAFEQQRKIEIERGEEETAAAGTVAGGGGSGRRQLRKRENEQSAAEVEVQEDDIGDATLLGPLNEPDRHKRRRLAAMLVKLPQALTKSVAKESNSNSSSGPVDGKGVEEVVNAASAASTASTASPEAAFGVMVNAAASAIFPDQEEEEEEDIDSGDDDDDADEKERLRTNFGKEEEEEETEFAVVDGNPYSTELSTALQGLPWELILTREAFLEWGGLDAVSCFFVSLFLQPY